MNQLKTPFSGLIKKLEKIERHSAQQILRMIPIKQEKNRGSQIKEQVVIRYLNNKIIAIEKHEQQKKPKEIAKA